MPLPKPPELNNWKGDDPRIDPRELMSVEGFIGSLQVLGSLYPDNEIFQSVIERNLAWAANLEEDAVIRWIDDHGMYRPVVVQSTLYIPT